jgi:tRNA(adenine34) deaminase
MARTSSDDVAHIRRCLELAREAAARGEVPVGAVVVRDGTVIGTGSNRCEERRDPFAHAELLALLEAVRATGEARLTGAVLYSSLEPCFMCAGALIHARIARVVFAARDPKFGACGSLANLPLDPRMNHRCPVDEGILADESGELLRDFFRQLR